MQDKIGWIGLGSMGNRMAKNLAKNGYQMLVTDKMDTSAAPQSAHVATTNSEVISEANILILSIPAGPDTLEITQEIFNYPSSVQNDITYAANYPLTNTSATGSINNASPGWYSAGPFSEPVIFFNDIRRTDEQRGVFGELSFATSDTTELSIGARWYDIEVDFEGSANSSFGNGFGNTDQQKYGSNLSAQYAPGNSNGYPDKAETDGVIGKVTYSWKPNDDSMYYLTWSEGFRPGLLNRPAGRTNSDGSYTIPAAIDSDEITNYEFGWKSTLMDGRMILNGAIFRSEYDDKQESILIPVDLTNVCLLYTSPSPRDKRQSRMPSSA